MVFSEIRVVPYPGLPIFVESDQSIVDSEGSQIWEQLMKTQKRLTQHIQSLLMR